MERRGGRDLFRVFRPGAVGVPPQQLGLDFGAGDDEDFGHAGDGGVGPDVGPGLDRKVSSYAFPTVGRVTVSVGWVPIESQSLTSDLIHRADQALYKAKQAGRNLVLSYAEAFGETSVLSDTAG